MRNHNLTKSLFYSIALASVVACATHHQPAPLIVVGNTSSLAGLKAIHVTNYKTKSNKKEVLSAIRRKALEETASSVGAQSGLAWQAHYIDRSLGDVQILLGRVYNFNALILQHNVIPPVLIEAQNVLNLDAPDVIRLSDKTYRIVKQAHFVTTPPDWRQYLWMDYEAPDRPDASILPRTKEERGIWEDYVTRGWTSGLGQAYSIYSVNLARLQRDFKGILLYHKLRAQHMVSAPFVATTDLGVTGDHKALHINDRVLRISVLPALQPNSTLWKAVVAQRNRSPSVIINNRPGKLPPKTNRVIITNNPTWRPVISPTA